MSKATGASTLTTLYFAPQCGQSISDGGGFDITANMPTKIRKMKPDNNHAHTSAPNFGGANHSQATDDDPVSVRIGCPL